MRLLALTLVALAVAASAAAHDQRSAMCAPTFAGRLETGSATQLITVVARTPASTQGSLRLWTKRGACWRQTTGPWTAPQRITASNATSAIDGPQMPTARGVATSDSAALAVP